jgi:hypothetical protein
MNTAFFTKRTHPENQSKVNNGGVKGKFFWRPNLALKCPKRTHSNPIQPNPTKSNQMQKYPPTRTVIEFRALTEKPC